MTTRNTPQRAVRLASVTMLIVGVVWAGLPAHPARAAAITVTTTADELNTDGDCSLREAVAAANDDIGVDACTPGSGADTRPAAAPIRSRCRPGCTAFLRPTSS